MSTKPIDGFAAPLSVTDRMAKVRAARSVQPDCTADKGDELGAGVCTDLDKRPSTTIKVGNSPLRAIRAYCYDCTCGSSKEIELCPAPACPLYPFRFGKRPSTVRKHREAQEGEQT